MKSLVLLFLVLCTNVWAQEGPSQTRKSFLEFSVIDDYFEECMEPENLGPCPKPSPLLTGVKIRYWEPEVFMETVKKPGDYVIREWGGLLEGLYKDRANSDMKEYASDESLQVTSNNSSGSLDSTNLQFNEAHVYTFPLNVIFKFFGANNPAENIADAFPFASELNSVMWRTGKLNKDTPDLLGPERLIAGTIGLHCQNLPLGEGQTCMKSWGSLYPRQGFVVTSNPAVASVVDGLRAVSAAGVKSTYIKIPLDFDLDIPTDKIQMVYPNRKACHPIGYNPRKLEQEGVRNDQQDEGRYVWILWHKRTRCFGIP